MVGKLLSIRRPVRSRSRPGSLWRGLEALEQRQLLSAIFPTDAEQYMIEVINQQRANPQDTAAAYHLVDPGTNTIDLNEGLAANTISPDPKQPLAFNPSLGSAAQDHSQWMVDNNNFTHYEGDPNTNTTTYTPQERDNTAGYDTPDRLPGFENIAAQSQNGPNPSIATVDVEEKALFVDSGIDDRGHRTNLMNPDLSEIGVGMAVGPLTYQGNNGPLTLNSLLITQDFAANFNPNSAPQVSAFDNMPFLTGVVYVDKDHNNFYTPNIGEGLDKITITATPTGGGTPFVTTTWAAGGYSLPVPNGTYSISATGTGFTEMDVNGVVVNGLNVEEDFVPGAAPAIPAIAVQFVHAAIANGDTTPATPDGTEFGPAPQGGAPVVHTFTIKDTGAATLHLTGTPVVNITGANAGDFTVVAQPATTVSANGGTVTFQVQFQPSDLGLRTATVTIASDDPSQGSFTFNIEGTGAAPDLIGQVVSITAPDPGTLVPGDKVKVVVKVTNRGTLAAGASTVELFASTGQTLDIPLATMPVSALTANGGTKNVTFNITVGNAAPGSYFLLAEVDAGGLITESNEANNVASSASSKSIVWQFGTVGTRKNVKLVLTDGDGTIDTFALAGSGTGTASQDGDVTVDNPDATTAVTITTKKSKLPGDDGLTSVHNLTINGSAKSFVAKTTNINGDVNVTGTIATLQADNFTGPTVQDVNIGAFVKPTDSTTLTFHSLNGVVLHSLTAIKTLTIADAILDSIVTTTGNIGTATIGAMENSTLFAGVAPGVTGLPTSDQLGAATIGTFTIKGIADHLNGSFENSFVAAATINSATIHDVETSNNHVLFGFVAKHIKKMKRLDAPKSIMFPSTGMAGDADTNPNDDFVIQIVV